MMPHLRVKGVEEAIVTGINEICNYSILSSLWEERQLDGLFVYMMSFVCGMTSASRQSKLAPALQPLISIKTLICNVFGVVTHLSSGYFFEMKEICASQTYEG